MKPRPSALLGAILLLATVLTAGHAQDSPIPSPLVERSNVQFVRGIRKEDLLVAVSGQAVELDLFEDWCTEDRPAPDAPPRAEPAAADATTAAAPEPIRYIFYFDLLHLKLAGLHQSFRSAMQWAENVAQPQDEVMVITGGDGLRIVRPLLPASDGLVQDLASIRDRYDATLSWAEMEGDANRGRIGEIYSLIQNADPRSRSLYSMAAATARSYAAEDFQHARHSIENLERLMSLFEHVDGTKNLLIFQDTLRLRPGLQYPLAEDVTETHSFLQQLAHAANQRNVRFYPVVAGGLGTNANAPPVPPAGNREFSADLQQGFKRPLGGDHLADDAMVMLASETGGRVTEGTNRLTAVFEDVVKDMSCFYRIGFRFPAKYDGDEKRITIQVGDGRRYSLRYRRSLKDPTPKQREVDRLRAAFLSPESARDLDVAAHVTPIFDHQRGSQAHIQISMRVAELLALRTDEGTRQAHVRLGGIVLPRLAEDEPVGRGIMAEVDPSRPSWDFSNGGLLRISDGSMTDQTVVIATEIHAPPGDYWLVAVAEDVLAGTVGATVAELHVPEEPRPVGDVHLLDDGTGALLLKMPDKERRPGKKRIWPAPSALPAGALLRASQEIESTTAASLAFTLCDPEVKGNKEKNGTGPVPLDGWNLQRTLTCGDDAGVPLRGGRIPITDETGGCFLVVDVPSEPLDAGACRYEVRVEPRSGPVVTRLLEFDVVAASDEPAP
jgi:VWFA-related protein